MSTEGPSGAASSARTYRGGCACGAVRYRALGPLFDLANCHCTLCRKTTGAPFVSWASTAAERFAFTRGEPRAYASSEHGVRTFCTTCGTQLTFVSSRAPDAIDLTLSSLDAPEEVAPDHHIWTASRLPWIVLDDHLPDYRGARST